MTRLEQYIAGWRAHDTAAILTTLTPDCVVIESFGPIYRGHDQVAQWVSKWLAEDGRVIDWTVRDPRSSPEGETAEWTFHYTWRCEEKTFDGATIAKLHDGQISYLREYATTAALYDWQGEWQPLWMTASEPASTALPQTAIETAEAFPWGCCFEEFAYKAIAA